MNRSTSSGFSQDRYSQREVVYFEMAKTQERKTSPQASFRYDRSPAPTVSQASPITDYKRKLQQTSVANPAPRSASVVPSLALNRTSTIEVKNFYGKRPPVEEFNIRNPVTHTKKIVKKSEIEAGLPVRSAWRLVGGESPAKDYQAQFRTTTFAKAPSSRQPERTTLEWNPSSLPVPKHLEKGEFTTYLNASLSTASGHPFLSHHR